MGDSTQQRATLKVTRGGGTEPAKTVDYEVPFESGASVLDGLLWIRTHVEPSLAFRYSCINANVCRECTMVVDGETTYACTARLKQGITEVRPLPTKRHIRDLVTDTLPPKERLFK